MDHVYDRLHRQAILTRLIMWGIFIFTACGFIIFTCLFFKSKTYANSTLMATQTYHIFMILFGIVAIINFIYSLLSVNIRYGRYKIDNHFITVYSGFIKNEVYMDEELVMSKCGPVVKMEVLTLDVPIYISCNIFSKIKVKFKDKEIIKTNRY